MKRQFVVAVMLAVGLSIVVSLLRWDIIMLESVPSAAANPTNLAQASSNPGEKEFITAAGWTLPPDYHGNPFAPGGAGGAWWWVFEPLFVYVPATGESIPRLGVSFMETTDALTVTLRTNAFWHDGTSFTSKDVRSTFMLGYLYNWTIWDYPDEIQTPDDYTVVFRWETPTIFGKQFMGRRVICAPHHLYREWADQVDLTVPPDEEPNKSVKAELEAFRPEIPIGTGPFELDTITSSEMVLTKFPNHYAADNVDFDRVKILRWEPNEVMWDRLKNGEFDAAHPATPKDKTEEIMAAQPTMKLALPTDLAEFSILFNLREDLLSDWVFREAIAHAIDRDELREVSLFCGLTDATYATGVLPSFADQWLSAEFLETLTPYEYDTTEAAKLLIKLGYVRGVDGFWETPEGVDLEFEIASHAGYSDWVLAIDNIAAQLTNFGIKAEARAVPGWEYWRMLNEGDYQMAIDWAATWWHFAHPWAGYNRMFAGETAQRVGFPEEVVGPEARPINLPDLVTELGATSDPDRQRELVETLAWVANEYLPQLPYLEKRLQIFHLDWVRVTGWPDNDDPIWSVAPGGIERVYCTLMTEGTIKAVRHIFLPIVLKNAGES